jgi:thiosulfate reductase cytochrome b subunit
VPTSLTLGGWLGGALQWHLTFMWIFTATGVVYVGVLAGSGLHRRVLLHPTDLRGVWPMVRHYVLRGPRPAATGAYNALQKLAYTAVLGLGATAVVTGVALWKPVQLDGLVWLLGGFRLVRVWHFAAICAFVAFIPGHVIMVVVHGWWNLSAMLVGWRRDPASLRDGPRPSAGDPDAGRDCRRAVAGERPLGQLR